MASDDKTVSNQVTDATTQNNVSVLANAPAHAIGTLYQTMVSANGMAMQNAVSNQQNLNQLNASIVAQAIKTINSK